MYKDDEDCSGDYVMLPETLQEVLHTHERWLNGQDGKGRGDLSFADLFGFQLPGRRLQKVLLQGANLSWTDLKGVNLSEADLFCANLQHADLSGSDLQKANLRGAYLSKANLNDAKLDGADLRSGLLLCGPRVTDPRFDVTVLRGASMNDASMKNANLEGADLREVSLVGASLAGANLRGADLRDADMENADLRGAVMLGCRLDGTDTSSCITDARFTGPTDSVRNDMEAAETDLTIDDPWSINPDRIEEMVKSHKKWLDSDGREGTRADFCNRTLTGHFIRNVSLDHAILRGALLDSTDLKEVSFVMADLARANFSNAKITGCQFDGSMAAGACFDDAEISNSTFRSVLREARPGSDADVLFPTNLVSSSFVGTMITECDFEGADVRGAEGTDFT